MKRDAVLSSCLPFLLALQTPRDLTSSLRSAYNAMSAPGHVSHRASPTIRFEMVSNATATAASAIKDKPIAVYLPGLDGYGISAATHQFDDLSRTFELWRLLI